MRMTATFVVGVAVLVLALSGCSQEVQSGEIVTCKKCGKELSNTVAVISVPRSKADKYGIKRISSYCQTCGDKMVSYKVDTACERCGKVYATTTETAQQRTDPHDMTRAEGFCSDGCRRATAFDNALDRGSQRAGDVMGRVGKGLVEGIQRHAR